MHRAIKVYDSILDELVRTVIYRSKESSSETKSVEFQPKVYAYLPYLSMS